MPTFVRIGRHWINLELVTSIEFVEDPNQAGKIIAVRAHFTHGKHQDFVNGTDIQALEAFLRNNQTP